MKRLPKWLLLLSILLVVFILLPGLGLAQANDPGCDPMCWCREPDGAPCPIDGGLSALLAIGVGYGIKKYKQSKKYPSLKGEVADN